MQSTLFWFTFMNFIPNILAIIKQFSKQSKGIAWNTRQQQCEWKSSTFSLLIHFYANPNTDLSQLRNGLFVRVIQKLMQENKLIRMFTIF